VWRQLSGKPERSTAERSRARAEKGGRVQQKKGTSNLMERKRELHGETPLLREAEPHPGVNVMGKKRKNSETNEKGGVIEGNFGSQDLPLRREKKNDEKKGSKK